MGKSSRRGRKRLMPFLAAILLVAALSAACGTQSGPAGPGAGASGDTNAPLQQTVVAQQTQIALLEGHVSALRSAAAAPRATAPAAPRVPSIPTLMPAVQGIPVDGTTKGFASAKVVLDEYSDFQ